MSKSQTTPKDVFLHVLSMVTLYISVISAIVLLFQYVNTAFPDALDYYRQSNTFSAIRSSIASMIVTWPLYIFVNNLIQKDYKKDPAKKDLGIRKWITYFTLFIAAIVIIINLITLIFNFLGGELTVAFILKAISILSITGSVFTYYLWDLKHTDIKGTENRKLLGWVSSIAVIIAIVSGFFIMGSPATQRAQRLDEKRVGDLQRIQNEVINYWQTKGVLPESMNDLENFLSGFTTPTDPNNSNTYTYEASGELRFRLCATFETKSDYTQSNYRGPIYFKEPNNYWQHDAGKVCFERTIDPERIKGFGVSPLLKRQ